MFFFYPIWRKALTGPLDLVVILQLKLKSKLTCNYKIAWLYVNCFFNIFWLTARCFDYIDIYCLIYSAINKIETEKNLFKIQFPII